MKEISNDRLELINGGGFGQVIEATAGSLAAGIGGGLAMGAALAGAPALLPAGLAVGGVGLIVRACN